MVPICFIGKSPYSLLAELMGEFFCGLGETVPLFFSHEGPLPQQMGDSLVLLFQDSFGAPCGFPILTPPENTVAVANAQNVEVLQGLEGTSIRTITCGLSTCDTFTLASSTEDSVVAALQRSIVSFRGEIVEPMEFPVYNRRLLGLSRYALMAFCAVGCLEGQYKGLLPFLAGRAIHDGY